MEKKTKLDNLRAKWLAYKKNGDLDMCRIIEWQAKILKENKNEPVGYEAAKKLFPQP